MRLLVSIDANNIMKDMDGTYWCDTLHGYEFWLRYLEVFENILGASRVDKGIQTSKENLVRVDGENVVIAEFPMKKGMKEYILSFFSYMKAAKKAVSNVDCAVVRLPSVTGFYIMHYVLKKKIPVAIEVVADPEEAYSTNKIAQKLFSGLLKKAVLSANGVSYVTKNYLQSKYPSKASLTKENNYFESYYSSINLTQDFFAEPKKYEGILNREIKIIHTANSINNYLKGHDILLKVCKVVRDKGYNTSLIIVGDGRIRKNIEDLAVELGIQKYVTFTGLLSTKKEVRDYLISSDIYVFPTKAEGLSRSLIEAMAVGLPCIATPVGGTAELLEEEYMLNPEDVQGFASKIIELINNSKKMEIISMRNIEIAKNYSIDKLSVRRNQFYNKLRKLSDYQNITM